MIISRRLWKIQALPGKILYIYSQVYFQKKTMSNKIPAEKFACSVFQGKIFVDKTLRGRLYGGLCEKKYEPWRRPGHKQGRRLGLTLVLTRPGRNAGNSPVIT
jgi:hypothetical protein